MLFTHARIVTMDNGRVIEDGYLLTEGEKIREIGDMKLLPDTSPLYGDTMVDLEGSWLLPGFIDAHSHLGIFNDSLNAEGDDGNESTDPVTPHLRAIDGIHNADVCFREAYEGCVSVVMTGPGSGNVLGGQFALMYTYERTVDRALICASAAQKAAFGENPKTVYGKDNKAPATRMGTAAILRDTLFKTVEYSDRLNKYLSKKAEYEEAKKRNDEDLPDEPEKPDFDFISESMLPVVKAEMPLKIHAHRQDDILTAVRICNEFGLIYTLEHCTEGHLIADILFEEYTNGQMPGHGTGNRDGQGGKLLGVIAGPTFGDRSKPELSRMTITSVDALQKAGIPVAIMTDHPCMPQQYLPLAAAIAVRGGVSNESALQSITSVPAKILGIDSFLGSLAAGKQADFGVFSGDPLDVRSRVRLFVGKGIVRYDPEAILSGTSRGSV